MLSTDAHNDSPGIQESYLSAVSTNDLTVDAERRGDADVLIASGMSETRLGGMLARLRSEFDAVQHPRKVGARPPGKGETPASVKADAHAWHLHELGLMLQSMKGFPAIRRRLAAHATEQGAADGLQTATEFLVWWLAPRCAGERCVEGFLSCTIRTGRMTTNRCKKCQGTGYKQMPGGKPGKELEKLVTSSLARWRTDVSQRCGTMQHHQR